VKSLQTLKYEGAIIPSDNVWAKKDSIFASTPAFELLVNTADGQAVAHSCLLQKARGAAAGGGRNGTRLGSGSILCGITGRANGTNSALRLEKPIKATLGFR